MQIPAMKKLFPLDVHRHFIQNGIRANGRNFLEARQIQIILNPFQSETQNTNMTSSCCKLGNTLVSCQILKNPNNGDPNLKISIQEMGKVLTKSEQVSQKAKLQLLEQIVRMTIEQDLQFRPQILSKTKLDIKINIELNNGNIVEAIVLSVQTALCQCKSYHIAPELQPSKIKIALTYCQIFGVLIRDPDEEEEALSETGQIVVVIEQISEKIAFLKDSGMQISENTLEEIIEHGQQESRKLFSYIQSLFQQKLVP